jgi:low temperature requirement protein LtrA
MGISLVMSAALPEAFTGRAVPFAFAYVAIQVVRSVFIVWAFPPGDRMRRNFAQLLAWSCIAGAIWIAGAFTHGDTRLEVWLIAIIVDVGAPMHGFRLPRAGATPMSEWTLAGGHLAERCQLVLMIALGEVVLRVGLTFSEQHGSPSVDASFVVGFLAVAGLWASYFLQFAERGAQVIAGAASDAATVGRSGYTYAHAVMVGAGIVVAVAIRLTIEEPDASSSLASGLTMLGGPGLFFAGLVLFKLAVRRGSLRAPITAIGVLAVLGGVAAVGADRLVVMVCAALVIGAMAVGAVAAEHD